jgi:type VI secretion system protein ImpK
MTLLELCEPLFQYVCRLNRSVRKGVRPGVAQVRSELQAILADMKGRAAADRGLAVAYDRVRLPLVFFADFMVRDCGAFGRDWRDLANDETPPELGGDEKFFDLLDEALKESGEAAAERLAVFYTCIGLGMTGWYQGQPEFLRKKMLEISSRIRGLAETDEAARICPEAYEHVNTADLVQPPGSKMIGIGIALVGLLLVVFAANVAAFLDMRSQLREALRAVEQPAAGSARADAGGEGAP